jgi:hypothetical protein
MICIDFRAFPTNPLLFGLTLFGRKHLFLAFLTFQKLRDSEKGKVKEHGLEISRRTLELK